MIRRLLFVVFGVVSLVGVGTCAQAADKTKQPVATYRDSLGRTSGSSSRSGN